MSCWLSLTFINLRLCQFKREKLTAPYQPQNCFGNLAHIACIEKIVMLLIHKDISHMPITELENNSESVWVKVFANKTSHLVARWYRPPGGDLTKLESQLMPLKS